MSLLAELVGQTLDNKYRIEKQLGQGGMGAVYLATHIGTLRPVAVKVITPQFMSHTEFVERFRREAEAAGRLRHPNVVNVTDFGFAELGKAQLAYLVMEYLDGCNLGDVLKEEKNLPLNWVVDILEQTCLAVEKAHTEGIIHRDLKPDNIWLEPNERGGFTVKVLDFGLAKLAQPGDSTDLNNNKPAGSTTAIKTQEVFQEAVTNVQNVQNSVDKETKTAVQVNLQSNLIEEDETKTAVQPPINNSSSSSSSDEEKTAVQIAKARTTQEQNPKETKPSDKLTQAGAILGTPVYMSPEQCVGETLDKRSDIYSLGVIAYEMLTSEPPFKGNFNALMMHHLSSPPPSILDKRPDIPKAVADLIASTLSKQASERPVSAVAFANALRARSETAASVMRQAFGLYAEHFATFLQISVVTSIPIILVFIFSFSNMVLTKTNPNTLINSLLLACLFIGVIANLMFTRAINGGISIPLLAQLIIAPLKEISIKPAIEILKKRLRIFVLPALFYSVAEFLLVMSFASVFFFIGNLAYRIIKEEILLTKLLQSPNRILVLSSILLVMLTILTITGRTFVKYSLYASVVIIEGFGGLKALRRAKSLYLLSRKVTMPIMLGFLIYLGLHGIAGSLVNGVLVRTSSLGIAIIITILFNITHILVYILLNPFITICLGLLYFKARQINGESLKDVLAQYQPETLSLSHWQTRISKGQTSLLQSLRKSSKNT
ncbi:MAG: serine/threonine-protein kinase [Blastocatellia bacterium]